MGVSPKKKASRAVKAPLKGDEAAQKDKEIAGVQVIGGVREQDLTEAPIAYSPSKIISLAKKQGHVIKQSARAGCEKWSIKAPFKSAEYKKKMMACKAAAEIKGLQASIAYATKLARHCNNSDEPTECKKKLASFIIDTKHSIKEAQRYLK